jgi:anti-sigma regulatory factor (Ser/Thr protein kinase)
MRAWSLLSIEEPATAITAELVANAVRHARSDLELRLIHRGPRIRIEVSDNDPSLPILTRPSGLQVGGRGMLIVDQYATDWGTTRTPGGKTVWADIDLTADDLPWRPGGL